MNTLSDVFGIPLDYDGECNEMCDEAFAAIEALPAVDAVPVVHARWIDPCVNKYGHPCHHCSACRFKASQKDRNFCPNCGARMDEKEND